MIALTHSNHASRGNEWLSPGVNTLDTLAPELMLHLVRGAPVGNRSIGAVVVGYTLKRHVPFFFVY